jgi:hypothetical protein
VNVKFLNSVDGRFVVAVYLFRELEPLPSNSLAMLAYLRMAMLEDRAAA